MADDQTIGGAATLKDAGPAPRLELKAADPCALVLFGATGDLAKRLVVPALYNLACSGALPAPFTLIGVARREHDVEAWRRTLWEALTGPLRQDRRRPDQGREGAGRAGERDLLPRRRRPVVRTRGGATGRR